MRNVIYVDIHLKNKTKVRCSLVNGALKGVSRMHVWFFVCFFLIYPSFRLIADCLSMFLTAKEERIS